MMLGSTNAFAPTAQKQATKSLCGTKLHSLKPLYDELAASVTSKFGLQRTDFTDTYGTGAGSWQSGASSGTADWLSESSPQFLTGVSTCTRTQSFPMEELTINVWMGPSYDCPHVLLTFGQESGEKYYVKADYIPRGSIPLGSDPQYLESFYGADVQGTWKQAMSQGYPLPPALEFESRVLDSPLRISQGGLPMDQASAIAKTHLERLYTWVDQAQPVPARSRGSFNLRDDKIRQFFYRGQMNRQRRELGDSAGAAVAAMNTGPTAEAYVGGGS